MKPTFQYHWFLDESGDTTFYGKKKKIIIGDEGVSNSFILGWVQFNTPLNDIRNKIIELQNSIVSDSYYKDIPSIQKKIKEHGYFFHAKDDVPEVRKTFYEFINTLDINFEAIVGRKTMSIFEKKYHTKGNEFYADMLSHLLKNQLGNNENIVINIAHRKNSTEFKNLNLALEKAINRYSKQYPKTKIAIINFNVQNQYTEPLLNIADYLCWAIQRVFERGEMRYHNFIQTKIKMILDIYDFENRKENRNVYTAENPLSIKNKISPVLS